MKRVSRQKNAVLDVLRQTDSHPTADWIYDEVRKLIPNISKGTVYRNLKILKDSGEITGLNINETPSRYEGNLVNHSHFRCQKCRRIFDIEEQVDKELEAKVARSTGFKIVEHRLEFSGLCIECK